MSEPLRVVCWKWKPRPRPGYPEPPCIVDYGPEHVHTLRNMVARNLDMPHEFVCITDDPEGLDPAIRIVPLWDDCIELGGCYNRLRAFSPEMRETIGPRFVWIDLDCVVVGRLDPLFDRDDDFIVNSYKGGPRDPDQRYNGGMVMMDAGARPEVWEQWNGQESIERIRESKITDRTRGSDQGWMRMVLDEDEARWTEADGVYEARQVRGGLPANARIVFFAGRRDPTLSRNVPWVRKHYR